jgi:integrase
VRATGINRYLDRERLRRVADLTLSSYAYGLLHFVRWWQSVHHTDAVLPGSLTDSTLLDYVRFQSAEQPQVSGSTINHRVAVVDRALHIMFPGAPAQTDPGSQTSYWRRGPMGLGKPRPALSRLRVKTPKRIIVPLSVDQVARFWSSFRTSRDLAIVGLMLLQGLKSQEVLNLNRDDLLLPEAQIRVTSSPHLFLAHPCPSQPDLPVQFEGRFLSRHQGDTIMELQHVANRARPTAPGAAAELSNVPNARLCFARHPCDIELGARNT